ncbi:unnamed protein product [Phytophthora fragariaefolia]|uniref:Unnamed protein product n=1 Tax=Phytophthora fragariaefolia TaxID=1490495 RepID=A0A9W6XW63_9STRA|nr:unnamed protein product [Phytophthora fragariaefolia]
MRPRSLKSPVTHNDTGRLKLSKNPVESVYVSNSNPDSAAPNTPIDTLDPDPSPASRWIWSSRWLDRHLRPQEYVFHTDQMYYHVDPAAWYLDLQLACARTHRCNI